MNSNQSFNKIITDIQSELVLFQTATIDMVHKNLILLDKLKKDIDINFQHQESTNFADNEILYDFHNTPKFKNEERLSYAKKRAGTYSERQCEKKQRLISHIDQVQYGKKRKPITDIFKPLKKLNMQ